MKNLIVFFMFVFAFGLIGNVYAVSDNANQNQAQAQTQNAGEESQIQNQETTTTQSQTGNSDNGTQTQLKTQEQLIFQDALANYEPKNQNSYMHMNQMQAAVSNMLNFSYTLQNEGVASQLQTMAQNQIQSEDKINEAIDKADERGSVSKFFLGPDYKQLKIAKQEMEQNQLRIEELNQIMLSLSNSADQSELQNIIEELEMQNTELQNQLQTQTQGFSLLGWFFRWLNKY